MFTFKRTPVERDTAYKLKAQEDTQHKLAYKAQVLKASGMTDDEVEAEIKRLAEMEKNFPGPTF